MKRFQMIKTIQLILLIALAVTALLVIFLDPELYHRIAEDPRVRLLCFILWLVLGLSFVFLLYDLNSYTGLRRENLELDNAVYSDALTGVANRYSVDAYIGQFLNKPLPADMGCVTIDLTNLSEINFRQGHSGGDAAILAFADMLQSAAQGSCFVGRNGGNKFVAIFRECSRERLEAFEKALAAEVGSYNEKAPESAIRYVLGSAFDEGSDVSALTELVALSDRRAFAAMKD